MIAAIAGAASGAALMAWLVRGRSATLLAPSVWRGPKRVRQIALTFDDGPSEGTREVLDALDGAPATFFQCGANVDRLPAIASLVSKAGHAIGNHTWTHKRLDFTSRPTMRDEIGRTQRLLTDVHGQEPRWFRAPYGVRWFGLGDVQREFGLRGVMWSCLARDYRMDAGAIARRVIRSGANGLIVCLHDGRILQHHPDIRSTIEATRLVVQSLRAEGYTLVTLDEMFAVSMRNERNSAML